MGQKSICLVTRFLKRGIDIWRKRLLTESLLYQFPDSSFLSLHYTLRYSVNIQVPFKINLSNGSIPCTLFCHLPMYVCIYNVCMYLSFIYPCIFLCIYVCIYHLFTYLSKIFPKRLRYIILFLLIFSKHFLVDITSYLSSPSPMHRLFLAFCYYNNKTLYSAFIQKNSFFLSWHLGAAWRGICI